MTQDGIDRPAAHRIVGVFLARDFRPAGDRVQRRAYIVGDSTTDLIAQRTALRLRFRRRRRRPGNGLLLRNFPWHAAHASVSRSSLRAYSLGLLRPPGDLVFA